MHAYLLYTVTNHKSKTKLWKPDFSAVSEETREEIQCTFLQLCACQGWVKSMLSGGPLQSTHAWTQTHNAHKTKNPGVTQWLVNICFLPDLKQLSAIVFSSTCAWYLFYFFFPSGGLLSMASFFNILYPKHSLNLNCATSVIDSKQGLRFKLKCTVEKQIGYTMQFFSLLIFI